MKYTISVSKSQDKTYEMYTKVTNCSKYNSLGRMQTESIEEKRVLLFQP